MKNINSDFKATVKTANPLPAYKKNCSVVSAVKKVIMFYGRKFISAYNIDYLWKETNKVSAKIKNTGSENLINIDFILIYNQPNFLSACKMCKSMMVWYFTHLNLYSKMIKNCKHQLKINRACYTTILSKS